MRVQRWTIISLCLTAKPDGNIAVWWKINHRVKSVVTQIKWNVIIYEIQMVLTEWKSDGSYWLLKLMYSFMVLSLRLAFQLIHMSEIIAKTIKMLCNEVAFCLQFFCRRLRSFLALFSNRRRIKWSSNFASNHDDYHSLFVYCLSRYFAVLCATSAR